MAVNRGVVDGLNDLRSEHVILDSVGVRFLILGLRCDRGARHPQSALVAEQPFHVDAAVAHLNLQEDPRRNGAGSILDRPEYCFV